MDATDLSALGNAASMGYSKSYLERLIADRIEESGRLDYKRAAALSRDEKKMREIAKDISAFANSVGGIIIYGIAENPTYRHLPERLDAVDCREYSKEWLAQISGAIQPRIEGLRIIPVHLGPQAWEYAYVVEIPQSDTAHQATDLRYYRRRNFESTPMEDYEIREAMNRRKHPLLTGIVRMYFNPGGENYFVVRVSNISKVIARHFSVKVRMPLTIGGKAVLPEDAIIDQCNGLSFWRFSLNNRFGVPLFPDDEVILRKKVKIGQFSQDQGPSITSIEIRMFADEMEKIELSLDPSTVIENGIWSV